MGKEFHSFLARASDNSPKAKRVLIILSIFIALMGVYVGGYLLCLNQVTFVEDNDGKLISIPVYTWDFGFESVIFSPYIVLDKFFRQNTWYSGDHVEVYIPEAGVGNIKDGLLEGIWKFYGETPDSPVVDYYIHSKKVTKAEWEEYEAKQKK